MSPSAELLAWAAGLYDGEGSASMYVPRARNAARRQMQISQGGIVGVKPEVLVRFRGVVAEGNITGPYRGYLFYWKTTRKDGIDRVAALLWPHLGVEKRMQFERMTIAALRPLPVWPSEPRTHGTELAWAAGLFDGEGSAFVSGAAMRAFVKLEVPQSSAVGVPETLVRFREAIGAGAIGGPYPPRSPWSRLPQYRWSLGARDEVARVLAALWPWLSRVKRSQAVLAEERVHLLRA